MPLTVAQLQTPITRAQALTVILNELNALGFSTTSWQSGSVQRTLLTGVAEVYSRASLLVSAIAQMAFNDSSRGSALTKFSNSHYDNQRIASITTRGTMRFTGGAVGPPYTVAVGAVVVRDTATGQRFRNIVGGTIPASGFVDLSMEAEVAGTAGNLGTAIATLQLVTSFAGVTVTNPAIAPTTTWITRQGAAEETDAALRRRNTLKWASIPMESPPDGYEFHAIDSDTDVTRVLVDDTNPRGPGTVDVYVARATGVATGPRTVALTDANTVFTRISQRRAVTADVEVFAATAFPVNVTATCHVTASLNTAAKQDEIQQAARDYINSLPIGGEVIPPATTGSVVFSELIGAITAVAGVRRVAMATPVADVSVPAFQVATPGVFTFTFVNIT